MLVLPQQGATARDHRYTRQAEDAAASLGIRVVWARGRVLASGADGNGKVVITHDEKPGIPHEFVSAVHYLRQAIQTNSLRVVNHGWQGPTPMTAPVRGLRNTPHDKGRGGHD